MSTLSNDEILVINNLSKSFPAISLDDPKPLALGVRSIIRKSAPHGLRNMIDSVSWHYVRSIPYLKSFLHYEHRYNLDGSISEPVSAEHRQFAIDLLISLSNS